MTKALMAAAMILGTAIPCAAMDSSDLLFHLSFDNGVSAEFARGSAQPLKKPKDVSARLVQGLFGKGYAFRGKASDLDFATGENAGPRVRGNVRPQGQFLRRLRHGGVLDQAVAEHAQHGQLVLPISRAGRVHADLPQPVYASPVQLRGEGWIRLRRPLSAESLALLCHDLAEG